MTPPRVVLRTELHDRSREAHWTIAHSGYSAWAIVQCASRERSCNSVRNTTLGGVMQDTKVGDDDARQAAQHDAVKSKVESRVNAEISNQASVATPDGRSKVADVA